MCIFALSTQFLSSQDTTLSDQVTPPIKTMCPCDSTLTGLEFTGSFYHYSPVLRTDMPLDIMISYILADSLLRFGDSDQVKDFLQRVEKGKVTSDNDTLRYAYKYLHKIMDYDPMLFSNFFLNNKIPTRSADGED